MWVWNCIKIVEGTGNGPVMKNMKYSSWKPVFSSQHTHGALLLPVTPVLDYLISAFTLCRHPHMCWIHSHRSTRLLQWCGGKRGVFDQNIIYACMRAVSNKRKVGIKTNFLNWWKGGRREKRRRRQGEKQTEAEGREAKRTGRERYSEPGSASLCPWAGRQRWQAESSDYKCVNQRAGLDHKIGS